MLLCNTFPGTMSEKGGMVGGVNCKSGMIYGKFVLLQNAYLSADLSLAEVVVYGTREGKAADMSSVQCVDFTRTFQTNAKCNNIHTVQKLRVISNKPPSTFDSCLSIYGIDSYIKSIK